MNQARIDTYTKKFGCRFLRFQKRRFLKELVNEMESIGYEASDIHEKRWFTKAENVFFGNIKQVKQVIVVPYDTPEKRFWPNVLYYPLDGNLTLKKSMMPLYAPAMVLFVILFVGVYFIQPKITNVTGAFLMSATMFAITMLLLYNLLVGFANRHNYNRTTSSVLCALEIAQSLSKSERQKVGFLFTDKNKNTYFGAESSMNYFAKMNKQPECIVLDCVGVGSVTQIGYNPQNRKLASELSKQSSQKVDCIKLSEAMRTQSMMNYYKKAVLVACGEIEQDALCVRGSQTSKDCILDMSCMDRVVAMIVQYIHKAQ